MIVAETKRLYLRQLEISDAEDFYDLNLDAEVLKYTGDTAFESIAAAAAFLENYQHYKTYGFGRWAVIDKRAGEFLGWCGLKFTAEEEEVDLGFRFFKKHWNKGYATEAAAACIDLGFKQWILKEIVGRVMVENIASIKVLEKTGLNYEKPFDFDGYAGLLYKIKNRA